MDISADYGAMHQGLHDMPMADEMTMCQSCREIDFFALFNTSLHAALSNHAELFAIYGVDRLAQDTWDHRCPMCRFFRDMAGEDATSGYLHRVWPNEISRMSRANGPCFLQMTPNKKAALSSELPVATYMSHTGIMADYSDPNRAAGLIVPSLCNFDNIGTWLMDCEFRHGERCNAKREPIPGLLVIDCKRRSVVELPPAADYATLSYVWGETVRLQRPESNQIADLPSEVPAIINDAIEVSIQMGLSFIWVDKYCIPQQDRIEKQRQIQMMGKIYSDSSLTIIDASNSSPSAGLAGVSYPRKSQPRVQVDKFKLVSTLPPVHLEIENSVWATRGWTYQEGQLARRRLVFTPWQTYYQCPEHYTCESIDANFDGSRDNRVPPGQFEPYFVSRQRNEAHEQPLGYAGEKPIADSVRTYMARSLSFQNDRLDAFSAMLRNYEKTLGVAQGHLMGVPLLLPRYQGESTPHTRTQQLLSGLLWYLDGNRREGEWPVTYSCFPSWSWVAWRWMPTDARFQFNFGGIREINEMTGTAMSDWVRISLKFRDGESVPWEDGKEKIAEKEASVAIECLCFDAWTFDLGIEELPVPIDLDSLGRAPSNPACLQHQEVRGLVLGYRSFRGSMTTLIALECGRPVGVENGHWRRVSHGHLYIGLQKPKKKTSKTSPIKYHGTKTATVSASIVPWKNWKPGRVKLRREIIDLY